MSFTDVKRNAIKSLALMGAMALAVLTPSPSHAARPEILWAKGSPLEVPEPNFAGPTPLFSPDGSQFIFAVQGTQVFRTSDQKLLFSIPVKGSKMQSYGIQYTGDGKHIVTLEGTSHGWTMSVWSTADGKLIRSKSYDGGLRLARDGRRFARHLSDPGTGASGAEVRDTLTDISLLNVNSTQVFDLSPDSRFLAVKEKDGTVRLWSVDEQKALGVIPNVTDDWISFPDNNFLIAGGVLYRIPDLTPGPTLPGGQDRVFSSDLFYVVTHDSDGETGKTTTRFWKLQNGQYVPHLPEREGYVSVSFTPDGGTMIEYISGVGTRLLRSGDGGLIREISGAYGVTVSPDGSTLALSRATDRGTVRTPIADIELYRVSDGQRIDRPAAHLPTPGYLSAFSPDNQILAATGASGIGLWNANDGTFFRRLEWEGEGAVKIEFSANGQRLISTHPDKLREWRVSDGTLLKTEDRTDESRALGAVISPDGQIVAESSTAVQGAIDLMRTSDRSLLRRLTSSNDYLGAIAFTADGKKLIVRRGKVQNNEAAFELWDVGTGATLSTLSGFSSANIDAISDGRILVLSRRLEGTLALGAITVHEVETGKILWSESFDAGRSVVALDLKENIYLVHNTSPRTLELRALDSRTLIQSLPYEEGDQIPDRIQFTTGRTHLIGFGSQQMIFWRLADGARVAAYDQEVYSVRNPITFSPDGSRMAYLEGGSGVFVVAFSPVSGGLVPGDLNADGKVDVADAIRSLRLITGLETPTPREVSAGDLNGDQKLTVQDTILILEKALGV